MITAAPIILLFVLSLTLLGIHLFRPGFAYHWLVAVLGTLVIWAALLALRPLWSGSLTILSWEPQAAFPAGLEFVFDRYAWLYACALQTLLLASLLTGIARSDDPTQPRPSWNSLASSILLTGFGLLACAAGNLILFQLVWLLVDCSELIVWANRPLQEKESEKLSPIMATRIASLTLLLSATALAIANQHRLDFASLAPETTPLLIFAAGLRLGVIPPFPYPARGVQYSANQGSILHLTACAPAVILLTRISLAPAQPPGALFFLILAGGAIISAGFGWLAHPDITSDPSHWISGIGALMVVSALATQPQATLAWGLAFLLAGGLLLQYHVRPRWLRPLLWIGAAGISSLPFLPTWAGAQTYTPPTLGGIVFVLGQSLLVSGYFRMSFVEGPQNIGPERWMRAFYILGLISLPITWIALSISTYPLSTELLNLLASLDLLLPGMLIVVLSGVILSLAWLRARPVARFAETLESTLRLGWLYWLLAQFALPLRRAFKWTNMLLEGQAGMIWAFLLLVLLITLLQQTGVGG